MSNGCKTRKQQANSIISRALTYRCQFYFCILFAIFHHNFVNKHIETFAFRCSFRSWMNSHFYQRHHCTIHLTRGYILRSTPIYIYYLSTSSTSLSHCFDFLILITSVCLHSSSFRSCVILATSIRIPCTCQVSSLKRLYSHSSPFTLLHAVHTICLSFFAHVSSYDHIVRQMFGVQSHQETNWNAFFPLLQTWI